MKTPTLITTLYILLSFTSCSFIERNTLGLFASNTSQQEQTPFVSSPNAATSKLENTEFDSSRQLETLNKVNEKPSYDNSAKVNIANLPSHSTTRAEPQKPSSEVEVIWAIPQEPVEGFIIRYGYTRDNLEKLVKVDAKKLQRYDDPKYGFIYRHIIRNLENSKSIYVTLAAYNGDKESEPSNIFEVGVKNS